MDEYSSVTQEEDQTLTCTCHAFRQTGKKCYHISAVELELVYGNVDRFLGE